MRSIYVEHRVDVVAVGYTYFIEDQEWQIKEQVSMNREVQHVEASEVPEYIKKAICVLMEGE